MAGTITVTHSVTGNVRKIIATCVADAADGSFPATALPAFEGRLTDLVVNPGATSPTAAYDLTVVDQNGHDVLEGAGANLSASATSKSAIVYAATAIHPKIDETDTLTLTLANNSVNSAQVAIELTYVTGG